VILLPTTRCSKAVSTKEKEALAPDLPDTRSKLDIENVMRVFEN
jgi:hypothetical protein